MLFKGLEKTAKLIYEMKPEEYHSEMVSKNKYIGALTGAVAGAAAAGIKKKTAKAALIGAGAGGVAGGLATKIVSDVYKNYKINSDYRRSYNMRVTPKPLS